MAQKNMNKDMQSGPSSQKEGKPEERLFYIGWMPAAPDSYARHVRKVVLAILLLVAILGVTLTLEQKQFFDRWF